MDRGGRARDQHCGHGAAGTLSIQDSAGGDLAIRVNGGNLDLGTRTAAVFGVPLAPSLTAEADG